VIRDYAAILMLTDQGVLPEAMVSFNDVEHLYTALSNGDVDCIVYSETGNTLIIESMGMNAADIEIIYLAGVVENYFAFNVETSDEIITLFQQNLDQLKLDKTEDGSSVYEKILNNYQVIQHINDNITPEMVIALVEQTAADIAADAAGTFAKMNQHLAPYKDQVNPALYSFAYDTAINMVAHADNELLVGVNFRGKTDAAGKKFRDEIVAGALEHQTGWTDYIYTKPDQSGLYYKTTYYQLVTGSDGAFYIVCAGRFK
jgi:polar amino acid transport system substrate-binding protein